MEEDEIDKKKIREMNEKELKLVSKEVKKTVKLLKLEDQEGMKQQQKMLSNVELLLEGLESGLLVDTNVKTKHKTHLSKCSDTLGTEDENENGGLGREALKKVKKIDREIMLIERAKYKSEYKYIKKKLMKDKNNACLGPLRFYVQVFETRSITFKGGEKICFQVRLRLREGVPSAACVEASGEHSFLRNGMEYMYDGNVKLNREEQNDFDRAGNLPKILVSREVFQTKSVELDEGSAKFKETFCFSGLK